MKEIRHLPSDTFFLRKRECLSSPKPLVIDRPQAPYYKKHRKALIEDVKEENSRNVINITKSRSSQKLFSNSYTSTNYIHRFDSKMEIESNKYDIKKDLIHRFYNKMEIVENKYNINKNNIHYLESFVKAINIYILMLVKVSDAPRINVLTEEDISRLLSEYTKRHIIFNKKDNLLICTSEIKDDIESKKLFKKINVLTAIEKFGIENIQELFDKNYLYL